MGTLTAGALVIAMDGHVHAAPVEPGEQVQYPRQAGVGGRGRHRYLEPRPASSSKRVVGDLLRSVRREIVRAPKAGARLGTCRHDARPHHRRRARARDLARLLAASGGSPYLHAEVVGKTVEGRDMLLLTVTNPSVSDANKKVLWLMARQHAWEAGTSWVAEGALRFLLSSDPRAGRIRDEAVFKIFPMADPDGVARGGVRFNEHGYDLNRNWDTLDAKLMPEIAAQHKAMLDWIAGGRRIDLFLTMHNTDGEYLAGPLSAGSPQVQESVKRFFELLVANTSFNGPLRDAGLSTTPGMPGRMTVNQGLFHDFKIPATGMEQTVEFDSKLGRIPTAEDHLAFGAGLVRCMWAAVTHIGGLR